MSSTTEEIQAVYRDDIDMKSYLVEVKYGKIPFYEGFKGMQVRKNNDYDSCETKYQGEK